MITAHAMTLVLWLATLPSTKNPVKIRVSLLIWSALIFSYIVVTGGSTWFPLILTLLFTGGILVIFIILSTFDPNTKAGKVKDASSLKIVIAGAICSIMLPQRGVEWELQESAKIFFREAVTSVVLTALILTYFSVFLNLIRKEKTSIKIFNC